MSLQQTYRLPWVELRSGVVADDTALTQFDYASMPDAAKKLSVMQSGVVLAFWGKAAEDKDTAYKVYGRRRMNGPVELIAAGLITLGSQAVTKNPLTKAAVANAYWVDTITNTAEWMKPVTIRNSANNGISYLCFDAYGLEDIYIEFDLDGGGDAMTEVNAIMTGA